MSEQRIEDTPTAEADDTAADAVAPTEAEPAAAPTETGGPGDDTASGETEAVVDTPTETIETEAATDDAAGTDGVDEADGSEAADGATPSSGGKGSRRSQLEKEGEVAADFLETLLDICDLDGDLDVDIDGDRAAVAIVDSEEGRVPRRLVGQDGQVLEALQELTRLAVQSETGERSRLMLDVAGHRAARRAELVKLAKEAIAEVKESGASSSLTPMTAFERKVVHDEVLAAGLVSESEGAEPRRYVVINPAE